MGHMEQYCPGTTKVYSYLTARNSKCFDSCVWFGIRYYIKNYLSNTVLKNSSLEEFFSTREEILGCVTPVDVVKKMRALKELGYWPISIKILPEGPSYGFGIPLMTITNTHPDFYWCVGFLESLLLKVWYPCCVATHSRQYLTVISDAAKDAMDIDEINSLPYLVHDFGYRGDASEESAMLSGGAHLLNSKGSDTVVAYKFMKETYPNYFMGMNSVPASEHSVMCSFGRENEIDAYHHMLNAYPTGIVSIVSDTYSIWNVLDNFVTQPELRDKILSRNGKVVFRPDSGDPIKIICGDDEAPVGTPENLGCLRLLEKHFGTTINCYGYKLLNPKVGLIYGDGMYLERYKATLNKMIEIGFSPSNLVIGVGGILRNHTRDDLGMAIKATYVEVNGVGRNIMKDPITDHSKKSLSGRLQVINGKVKENCSFKEEEEGDLKIIFKDGIVY
jgi:nicotinamide phosphoribosyltransferase